jgi:hypothetical protein
MMSKRTSNRPPLGASSDKLHEGFVDPRSLSPQRDSHSVGYNLAGSKGLRGGTLKHKVSLEAIASPTSGATGSMMAHSSVLGGGTTSAHNLRAGIGGITPSNMHQHHLSFKTLDVKGGGNTQVMSSGGDAASSDPDQELYLQFLKFKRQKELLQE